jgi:hypothetical protein
LLVNDRAEIGTLRCRLSSNLYDCALNRATGLGSVCAMLNLLISGREEVGLIGKLQSHSHALLEGGKFLVSLRT